MWSAFNSATTDGPAALDLPLPKGGHLACRVHGSGPRTVLLLHGFPEAAWVWDAVAAQVVAAVPGVRCVAPNLRGYPGSTAPAGVADVRPKQLVADVLACIAQLTGAQHTPVDVLVAHDWGGAVAWNLAAQRPALLRQLVLMNTPHPATFLRELRHNAAQQSASAYMNFFQRPDAAQQLAADGFAALWPFFGEAPTWLTPALRARYADGWQGDGAAGAGAGLEGPLNYYRASPLRPPLGADDPLHSLQLPDHTVTVTVPTTLLWGERDHALLPGLLDGLPHWVPHLQLQRVPEASHWIVHEQPARVAAAIVAALHAAAAGA
jgi:pimeloyl-ACP methyl ester carboxylesterase